MDYGQYIKNPQIVSHEEFEEGMTKKTKNRKRKEYHNYFVQKDKEKRNFLEMIGKLI